MGYLGLFTLLTLYFIIDCFIVNKRVQWLIPTLWTVPPFFMAINYKEGMEINGLMVLICYFMIFLSIKSLWGIKMWNTRNRKFHYITFIILYIFVYTIVYYVFNEAINIGYIPSFSFIESISLKRLAYTTLWVVLSFIFTFSIYNLIDKSLGKKSNIIIIQCKVYSINIFFGTIFSRYYIEGVNNGKYYPFEISKRMYTILKQEKILELKIKNGILGGKYVFENPCPELEKNALRRDKKIARLSFIFFILVIALGVYLFIL